jgi:PEP-CTERM motif
MFARSLPVKKCFRLFNIFALVFGGIVSANASPIFLLGSYGTLATNPGVGNTSVAYDPTDSTVNNGSTTTFNISPGTVWHPPTGSSSWVSFNPTTGPTSTFAVPNGDYIYTTTFLLPSTVAGDTGTLTVLADDTVSVFLNNSLILSAAGPLSATNPYTECSNVGPNCETPLTFTFTGLKAGLNTLEFDVKQVDGVDEGLDFSGEIDAPVGASSVPEPYSLALFGTGILGLLGVTRRYVNAR